MPYLGRAGSSAARRWLSLTQQRPRGCQQPVHVEIVLLCRITISRKSAEIRHREALVQLHTMLHIVHGPLNRAMSLRIYSDGGWPDAHACGRGGDGGDV